MQRSALRPGWVADDESGNNQREKETSHRATSR
jgi:hypothetical protein